MTEPAHSHSFCEATEFIGKIVTVEMDRPLGSRHPQFGFLYPVNYGFVPGVLGKDGEELDAYILGENQPLRTFEGVCVAVIHRLDDPDDKLVVAAPGRSFTDSEIRESTSFQEQYFESEIRR